MDGVVRSCHSRNADTGPRHRRIEMPSPSPTTTSPRAGAEHRPRGTASDWLLTAGTAVVLSVPQVGVVRLLDGFGPSTPVPDTTTPGTPNTAGAAPTAPAGKNASDRRDLPQRGDRDRNLRREETDDE